MQILIFKPCVLYETQECLISYRYLFQLAIIGKNKKHDPASFPVDRRVTRSVTQSRNIEPLELKKQDENNQGGFFWIVSSIPTERTFKGLEENPFTG